MLVTIDMASVPTTALAHLFAGLVREVSKSAFEYEDMDRFNFRT